MKIIKIGLPLIAVVAVLSVTADQGLRRQQVLTADAGALPEATVIANKMFGPRLAKSSAPKTPAVKMAAAKPAPKPLMAEASLFGH